MTVVEHTKDLRPPIYTDVKIGSIAARHPRASHVGLVAAGT
jgi:hypothetical protein